MSMPPTHSLKEAQRRSKHRLELQPPLPAQPAPAPGWRQRSWALVVRWQGFALTLVGLVRGLVTGQRVAITLAIAGYVTLWCIEWAAEIDMTYFTLGVVAAGYALERRLRLGRGRASRYVLRHPQVLGSRGGFAKRQKPFNRLWLDWLRASCHYGANPLYTLMRPCPHLAFCALWAGLAAAGLAELVFLLYQFGPYGHPHVPSLDLQQWYLPWDLLDYLHGEGSFVLAWLGGLAFFICGVLIRGAFGALTFRALGYPVLAGALGALQLLGLLSLKLSCAYYLLANGSPLLLCAALEGVASLVAAWAARRRYRAVRRSAAYLLWQFRGAEPEHPILAVLPYLFPIAALLGGVACGLGYLSVWILIGQLGEAGALLKNG